MTSRATSDAPLVLVLGGTRSGKSRWAEDLVATWGDQVTYLATAVLDPDDAAFGDRVAAHRARRPAGWTSVDVGADLAVGLDEATGAVLVDSLGTWVAAHEGRDLDVDGLLAALARRRGPVVVVSEEVGLSLHAPTAVGRAFVDALGTLNQRVAAAADRVVLVVAGRALELT